jgi:hypothetical protein
MEKKKAPNSEMLRASSAPIAQSHSGSLRGRSPKQSGGQRGEPLDRHAVRRTARDDYLTYRYPEWDWAGLASFRNSPTYFPYPSASSLSTGMNRSDAEFMQ